MTTEGQVTQSTALALPDEAQFRRDIAAINKFQQVVHSCMIKDQDYGVIPGTTKPTLLKPGAEKIAKLLGLADTYEILDNVEEWHTPFFRYLVKCKLVHVGMNVVISEGMGECNSMESKYRWRWVGERDVPEGIDKASLVTQERKSKQTGGHWTVYRLDNDDIYSQVNTILKMAKKRALVDAALSAGRLSDVFTQDIEDIPGIAQQGFTAEKPADRARTEPDKTQHWCKEHDTAFFMRGKMKSYAHPIGDTSEWCHEHSEEPKKIIKTEEPVIFEEPAQQEPVPAPEKKDERKVTKADLDALAAERGRVVMTVTDLGNIINKDMGWNIQKSSDLMKWQFAELMDMFKKM